MKKLLLISLIAFAIISADAQFYAGLGLGYGFGSNKRVVGNEITATSNSNVYGSYGQGFNINPKLGYMVNDNMGFELGIDYFMGATQTILKTSTDLQEGQSNALILAPQFVLKTDNGLYSRFGIFVPVAGKTTITIESSNYYGTDLSAEAETKGSFSVGVVAALGYEYSLNDNLSLFGELQYSGISVRSGTFEYTKFEVGGKDKLADMDEYDKKTEYVDELNSSSNNSSYNTNYDKDSAKEELKSTSPFSSFAINVGVIYKF